MSYINGGDNTMMTCVYYNDNGGKPEEMKRGVMQ